MREGSVVYLMWCFCVREVYFVTCQHDKSSYFPWDILSKVLGGEPLSDFLMSIHIFCLPYWTLCTRWVALASQSSHQRAAESTSMVEVWSLKCCWGQWHPYRSPQQVLSVPGYSIFPGIQTCAHNSVWSVIAPIPSHHLFATMKYFWMAPEVPWLACWLLFETEVLVFFEVTGDYEDETHTDKNQPQMFSLSLPSFSSLTYENQAT